MVLFRESYYLPESDTEVASSVELLVEAGERPWVHIETDPYEGHAMITLPVARLLSAGLRRAIRLATAEQKRLRKLRPRPLTSRMAEALMLRESGRRPAEIAREMGISPSRVHQLLTEAARRVPK